MNPHVLFHQSDGTIHLIFKLFDTMLEIIMNDDAHQ